MRPDPSSCEVAEGAQQGSLEGGKESSRDAQGRVARADLGGALRKRERAADRRDRWGGGKRTPGYDQCISQYVNHTHIY